MKDLEGIDTSNIIGESRGRRSRTSANSFFAPQRSAPVDLGDEDVDEDQDEDEEQESDFEEGMSHSARNPCSSSLLVLKKPKCPFTM